MNPLQLFNEVTTLYNTMKTNPGEISKLLLNNGRISKEQYDAIKDLSPSQAGKYLMDNGVLGQGQMGQLTQMAEQIRHLIGI